MSPPWYRGTLVLFLAIDTAALHLKVSPTPSVTSNQSSFLTVSTWYLRRARYLSVVFCNTSDATNELLTPLLRDLQLPMYLTTVDGSPYNVTNNDTETNKLYSEMYISYIFLAENLSLILQNMYRIKINQTFWNPRANILVIYYDVLCKRRDVSSYYNFFYNLWVKHKMVNVLVFILYSCARLEEEFLYFNPFSLMNSTSRGEVKTLNTKRFPQFSTELMDKLRDMRGYPVRISIFERQNTALLKTPLPVDSTSRQYYGADGYALTELAHFMNFTTLTHEPADGLAYGDIHKTTGNFTGAIGDILYDRADIAFNTRFVKDYRTNDVIFANQLASDQLCIIVPKAKRIPKWLTMLTSFNKNVYFFLLVFYLAFPNLWLLFHKIRCKYWAQHEAQLRLDVGNLYLESLLPFVNMSLVKLPTKRPEMILMMSCILLGFLVDSMYQAKLLTTITTPIYYRDIDTLEQLDHSNLIITTGSSNLLDTFITGTGNPVYDHLRAKTRINKTGALYDRVCYYNKFAAITRSSDFIYRSQNYYTQDGMPLLYLVKECPMSYYLSFMLPKQSAYLLKINDFIRRIFEAGLVVQWEQLTTFKLIHSPKEANKTVEEPKDGALKVFTVHDLQLPFFILIIGETIAAVVFMIEVLLKCRFFDRQPQHLHYKMPFLH